MASQVHYQIFDSDGDPDRSGTFEEFWFSEKIYKRSYTSENFTQIDFGTDHGLYRSGNQNWPEMLEMKARAAVVQPLLNYKKMSEVNLEMGDRTLGTVQLKCVVLHPKVSSILKVVNAPPYYFYTHYCFDSAKPILRFDSEGGGTYDALYNSIALFQGHYVGREIRIAKLQKTLMTIHIETLENLPSADPAIVAPTSDAVGPFTDKITLPRAVLNERMIKNCATTYPQDGQGHIPGEGTVMVQTTVGKDGHVSSTHVVSGPKALQHAAIECIKNREFQPFLVQGEAVEVESLIGISYAVIH